jgi:hypothetical protein
MSFYAPPEIDLLLEVYYPQELDRFYIESFQCEYVIYDAKKFKNVISVIKNEIKFENISISEGALRDIIRYSHK